MDIWQRVRHFQLLTRESVLVSISVFLGAAILTGAGLDRSLASESAQSIDEKVAALVGESPQVDNTMSLAKRTRVAIRNGDFATAKRLASEVLTNSRVESFRFYPFNRFAPEAVDLHDPEFEARLNAWVAEANGDALPLLLRAQFHYGRGWLTRGGRYASETPKADLSAFRDDMNSALVDVDASLQLDDSTPYGFGLKLLILQGAGVSSELQNAFAQAIARYPNYYPLYLTVLNTLRPQWGGSNDAMVAFVDRFAGPAPETSPLKLLYLELDRQLLASVAATCWLGDKDPEKATRCVTDAMFKWDSKDIEGRTKSALQLYDHTDRYQFSVEVGTILNALPGSGSDSYAGAVLELAAAGLNSDAALKPDNPHHNAYVIDEAVAGSWYSKGFFDNALEKYALALKDIDQTYFVSAQAKTLAIAEAYRYMAWPLQQLGRYADMIAYDRAAIALGVVPDQGYRICYGYYKLKDYESAVQACTQIIAEAYDTKAYYWRSRVYRDLGQIDAAERDLKVVAESRDSFRATAAIGLSMIHFDRKDVQGALDVLNKYTYLYDPLTASKQDMAVAYNNRCYAYMQLGQLKEALDDCKESLKYGSIPDAFSKMRELVSRLDTK